MEPLTAAPSAVSAELPPYLGMSSDACVRYTQPFGDESGFWIARCMAKVPGAKGTSAVPAGFVAGAAGGFERAGTGQRAFAELVEHCSGTLAGRALESVSFAADTSDTCERGYGMWPARGEMCSWIDGVNLCSGERTAVPALLAFLQWVPPPRERAFGVPSATGLAAHTDREACLLHGLLEVLERDACALSWALPNWPIRRITGDRIERLRRLSEPLGLELEAFEVGISRWPPVVITVATEAASGACTVGSACATHFGSALEAATREALVLHDTARCSRHLGRIDPATSLGHVLAAYGRGRAVLDWYLRRAATGVSEASEGLPLRGAVRRVGAAFDGRVLAADVTCPRAGGGWHVWRVVIPGAVTPQTPLNSSAFAGRLRALPEAVTNGPLHEFAHPFG